MNDDLISRQAVLGYIDRVLTIGTGKKKSLDFVRKYIETLPSAELETHEKRTETHACDLISRQAAIDVADAVWCVTGDKNVAKVWDQLKDLPSAQLIQCKECVYGNKIKDTIRCELMDYLPVECDHFCSWAERIDNR